MSMLGFLDRERTIARPGFSRWMVPPAALCMHLCIGQAYAFSVFNLPMTKLIGITQSAPDDWKLTDLGWIFSIAIFFLGVSAAVFGRWVEEGGPRRAMFTAACASAAGFLSRRVGVYVHQLWIVYVGYGVLGGIGLGIGYISPVSTLIKWFPDRPGMATGMAIMGFGGGAFIASPLSVWLMQQVLDADPHRRRRDLHRPRASSISCFMMVGAAIVRVPAPGMEAGRLRRRRWQPQKLITKQRRLCLRRAQDAAVLADLVGAVPQRDRRHRRARPGLRHEPGNVPRPCHARSPRPASSACSACSTWSAVSSGRRRPTSSAARTPISCFFVLGTVLYMPGAVGRRDRQRGVVRAVLRHHHQHVRRRLRDRSGLSQGHVRHPLCRRHPRLAAHRLVGGRASSVRCW